MKRPRETARPLSISPRLLRRHEAAAYMAVSIATVDALRARGEISVVPMPAAHLNGALRTPLFDVRDLDEAIEKWKTNGAHE